MKVDPIKTSKELYSVILKDLSAYGGFPFFGMAILVALILDDPITYRLAASLVTVTILVILVRFAYFKPRPGKKERTFETFYERIDNSSFPSIHAARAVLISFALMTKLDILPVYVLLVIIVVLSRLHFKRHDKKDIAAGLLIGLLLGYVYF
jgi:membrane-associated phospholipid phosphatase